MMSARTKFVHLYVKDETSSGMDGVFHDYGLYTFVEQINKSYLKNHGLDRTGQLYKINFFEFYPYEDIIMLKSKTEYDVNTFEEYLEIKGDDDHTKLIQMLQELNDYTIPIEEVFSKWFDEENCFSWLVFHILMGNKDTQSSNFFLYSPSNVNKFYFISWDNDGSLMRNYTEILLLRSESICKEFYLECTTKIMRPTVIVDYEREAFVVETGDVRITFDTHIRSGWMS